MAKIKKPAKKATKKSVRKKAPAKKVARKKAPAKKVVRKKAPAKKRPDLSMHSRIHSKHFE